MNNILDFWRSEWNAVADTSEVTKEFFLETDDDYPNGYYNNSGKYLGTDSKDGKVYVADRRETKKDEFGNEYSSFINPINLGVTHKEFQVMARVLFEEASSLGDKNECLWIAHAANNAKDNNAIDWRKKNQTLYQQLTDSGYSKTSAARNKTTLNTSQNNQKSLNVRFALIHVLRGGKDPTGNSVLWDGVDFLVKGLDHNKFKEYTQITISNEILLKFVNSFDGKVAEVFINSQQMEFIQEGKGKYHSLIATGTYGQTIFWRLGE